MVAFRLFSRLLGLAGTLIVARLLMPADFGVVAVASTITAATNSVTEVGVQDSLIRFKGDPSPLYNTAFTIQIVRAALSALDPARRRAIRRPVVRRPAARAGAADSGRAFMP